MPPGKGPNNYMRLPRKAIWFIYIKLILFEKLYSWISGLDENKNFSNTTFITVRVLDPLTSFVGSKNRGKEGISKTGSRMSRKIHVSSMTVDMAIRIVLHSAELVPFTHTTQSRLVATSGRWCSTLFCIPAGRL